MDATLSIALSLWCVFAFLAMAVLAICLSRQSFVTPLTYGMTALASLVACVLALNDLFRGAAVSIVLPVGLPWIGAHFHIDPLAAFFLVVVNLGGLSASVYGLGYGRHEEAPLRVLPFFATFLAGMNLVVLSADAFTFLLSWEFMSLASWALVMAHHRVPENSRAGYIYFVMASLGTFTLLLAFGLLAGDGGHYAFDAMGAHHLTAPYAAAVLALALVGAGSKAGLVPLHVWLPLAHPAAPSHVSALMSGVMTKVAIYAFIRIVFDLLGPPTWWWGVLVLSLGGISALMGVLYALFETDIKRLLACSTIENVGFIFVGLGLALAFQSNRFEVAGVLALTAALFHVFNHSVFKSLLFFGAGAVISATGERNIERLGGLIHRMPITAFAVLIGCFAISALPPLNGFASEWLTFQAILLSPELPQWGLKLLIPAIGAVLALSIALAAACFVRLFGIAFLGRARSPAAELAGEVDGFSLATLLALSLVCLLAGILPGYFIDVLGAVAQQILGHRMPQQSSVAWLTLVPIAKDRSAYNGLLVLFFVTASAFAAVAAIRLLASRTVRRAPAWGCGFPEQTVAMQYSAGSFAQPLRRVFGTLLFRAQEHIDMPKPGDLRAAQLQVELHDIVWEVLYRPLSGGIGYVADRLNVLQFLTIRRYLTLVFVALVILLSVLAIWH